MSDHILLLCIMVPAFGVFVLAALWLYFAYNLKAERLNARRSVPATPVGPSADDDSDGPPSSDPPASSDPGAAEQHHQPTKINPLALDLVLTLGTVYILGSILLALAVTDIVSDATVGALLAGMIGFVLGNRLGKSI